MMRHTRPNRAARTTPGQSVYHQLGKYTARKKGTRCCILYLLYTSPAYEYGTRPFLGGSGRRATSHTRQAVLKMPRAPSASPFSGYLRRQAINITPPRRVKAWGDGPLRPEVYPVVGHIRTNRAARDTAGRLRPTNWTECTAPPKRDVLYLSYAPPTYEYGTRPFFRWVRSQGRSTHATGSFPSSVYIYIYIYFLTPHGHFPELCK